MIIALYTAAKDNKYKTVGTCALATKNIDNLVHEFLDIRIMHADYEKKDFCVIVYPNTLNNTFEYEEPMSFPGTFKQVAEYLNR